MLDHVVTGNGFDKIFESNVSGHFLLTVLLLPHLAKNARVVSVSSEVHDVATKTGTPDPAEGFPASGDTQAWESLVARGEPFPKESAMTSGSRRYSRSKLLNVSFANQLGRILSGAVPFGVSEDVAEASRKEAANNTFGLPDAPSITSISMNPGLLLDTGFATAAAGKFLGTLFWLLMPVIRLTPLGRLMRELPVSGSDLAKLAVDPEYAGVTATYFDGAVKKPSSEFSRELESVAGRQTELWERLMGWAKVTGEEKKRAML